MQTQVIILLLLVLLLAVISMHQSKIIKTDEQIMDAADLNHPKLGQKIHPGDYYNPKGTRDIEKI